MARTKRERCYCGCGQAPAVSCRQRLVECPCGLKVRMTREWIERVSLSCSCGGQLVPVCLEDRARAGDESAWTEIMGRLTVSGVQSDRGKRGAAVTNGKRRVARAIAAQNREAGRDALPF